ncbi:MULTISPECIES: hypothetical protein [unclassified Bradyrhizobium]|uniref:hypothetical protein n=1 Tax=unclassified Bradyrhizobium TaxID=2631580 RepID=UPI002916F593|nr:MULTISPECIES: hypothetical protein [unclassified Bradyrhizobium]
MKARLYADHARWHPERGRRLLELPHRRSADRVQGMWCPFTLEQKIDFAGTPPAYMESSFCLMELGAAWAQGSKSIAIVVPPINYDTVTKTLGLRQAWKITDKPGLIDLREMIENNLPNLEARTEHDWDDKRMRWAVDLKKLLPKLQQATKIDADEHAEVLANLRERDAEVERLETALAAEQDRYAELEKLKDKQEVKALEKKRPGSKALQDEFDELMEAVSESKPKAARAVLRHLIADHFDRAGAIDWYSNREEFEDAVKYGLISNEGGDRVEWERAKLRPFRDALAAVQGFLDSDDGAKWREQQEPNVPTDADDLEFWEYHFDW